MTSCKSSELPSTGFRSRPPLPNQSSELSSLPPGRQRQRRAEEALGTDPEGAAAGAGPLGGNLVEAR